MPRLEGKKVAILITDGFEQVEMTEPRKALEDAGAGTDIISPAKGKVRGWKMTDWGESFDVRRAPRLQSPDRPRFQKTSRR